MSFLQKGPWRLKRWVSLFAGRADKLMNVARHRQVWPLLRLGLAPAFEHSHLESLDISMLVDVGANRGQFSALMNLFNPTVRVVAFEPIAPARDTFMRWADPDRFDIRDIAIGRSPGQQEMFVSDMDDSSSLFTASAEQDHWFPGTASGHKQRVCVGTLAKELATADIPAIGSMLKIDVQGAELDVLVGAAEAIQAFEFVYVEASFARLYVGQALAGDVVGFLVSEGHHLESIHNVLLDEAAIVQADFLFRRQVDHNQCEREATRP